MTDAQTFAADWVFDHVGVVVKSLAVGRKALDAVFPAMRWTAALVDPVNGVEVQFGLDPTGMVHELLVPLGPDSPVARALETRTNLLNHLAYRVADLDAAAAHMRKAGCAPAGPANPALAFGGHRIQFFITRINTIIELIEARDHLHLFADQA